MNCELRILGETEPEARVHRFSLPLGRPVAGEFLGYTYYLTFQRTTLTAASFQVARADDFFLHGDNSLPEREARFSGLGYDKVKKNSVYLGCEESSR